MAQIENNKQKEIWTFRVKSIKQYHFSDLKILVRFRFNVGFKNLILDSDLTYKNRVLPKSNLKPIKLGFSL